MVSQPSDCLGKSRWPEEHLSSTAEEGGGFYPLRLGETLDERFVITRKLGWGGNSSVWLAKDDKDDRYVAIKVLSAFASREIKEGRLAELELLQKIANGSPLHHGSAHVVRLLHEFTFENFVGDHVCFATDVLSYNVPALQSLLDGDPRLPLRLILGLAKHVLKGLEYLHDECEVIHSDLKPGNILLRPSDVGNIVMHELFEDPARLYGFPKTVPPDKLLFYPVMSAPLVYDLNPDKVAGLHWVIADLGHAHPRGKHLNKIVQPYALRAPEVILGLEWGPAVDIWSLGCMMYEFATGSWLFHPEAMDDIPRDVVHLAQMTQRTGQDHDDDDALKQYEIQKNQHDLKGMLKRAAVRSIESTPIESELNESTVYGTGANRVAFVRIMRSFLALDPTKRPRAAEALLDPAFNDIP